MTKPNHFVPVPDHNDTNAGNQPLIIATPGVFSDNALKEAKKKSDSTTSLRGNDHSAFRVVFAIHYTDLGMDQLYSELAALDTELERTKHIKRCLLDIVRGDFKRHALKRSEFTEQNRKSIWVRLRFSSRDVGLELLYAELLPMNTMFKRKSALRHKLYDAFNQQHLTTALSPAGITAQPKHHVPAAASGAQDQHKTGTELTPIQLAPSVPSRSVNHDDISQRRLAAHKFNAGQFEPFNTLPTTTKTL